MTEERPSGFTGFRRLGQRHLERLSQPGNRPRRTPPSAKKLGGVADGLVLAAETDVRRRHRRHALIAHEVIGNMPIGVGGRPQQGAGNGRVALAAKGQQGGGIGPFGRSVVLVPLQQPLGVFVAVQIHQGAQEQVAHALVVVGIQVQHFRIMFDRLGPLARFPQALGQPQQGPHERARALIEPEVALHRVEVLRADRPTASGHAFLQELPGLIAGRCLVGQDHVGVGAVGRHAQGLPRQFRLFLRPRGFPGEVGNFLSDGQGTAGFPRPEANFRSSPSRELPAEGEKPCDLAGRRALGLSAFFAFFFFLATIFPFMRGPPEIQFRISQEL